MCSFSEVMYNGYYFDNKLIEKNIHIIITVFTCISNYIIPQKILATSV